MKRYVALLRGINVGGFHKLPMVELRNEFASLGYKNIVTLLNTGNVLFDGPDSRVHVLEQDISTHLERKFGFHIPVMLRTKEEFLRCYRLNPYHAMEETSNIKLYVSFLHEKQAGEITLPWKSDDQALEILSFTGWEVYSTVDLGVTKTVKAMAILEQLFGKGITTRNWNSVKRIAEKL